LDLFRWRDQRSNFFGGLFPFGGGCPSPSKSKLPGGRDLALPPPSLLASAVSGSCTVLTGGLPDSIRAHLSVSSPQDSPSRGSPIRLFTHILCPRSVFSLGLVPRGPKGDRTSPPPLLTSLYLCLLPVLNYPHPSLSFPSTSSKWDFDPAPYSLEILVRYTDKVLVGLIFHFVPEKITNPFKSKLWLLLGETFTGFNFQTASDHVGYPFWALSPFG